MKESSVLSGLGLTRWEIQVYQSLLELGETKTGRLVEKSKVPQSKIYQVLSSLENKGLVSHIIKGKIKYFQAGDPEKLYLLFKDRENAIKSEVSKLKELKKYSEKVSVVRIFEGLRAIRAINAEIIKEAEKSEEFYGYSHGTYPAEVNELYHQFGELRKLAGINENLLITKEKKSEFERSISKEDLKYVRKKTRYCNISFPQDTAIFRNKVIIYSWEEKPKAILIESKEIAENYKRFFISLWKKAEN